MIGLNAPSNLQQGKLEIALKDVKGVLKEAEDFRAAAEKSAGAAATAERRARGVLDANITKLADELLKDEDFKARVANGANPSKFKADLLPVGSVVAWPGQPGSLENWQVCDGRVFDSSWDTEALRDALGSGRLPDLRGYFLRGAHPSEDHISNEKRDSSGVQGSSTMMPNSGLRLKGWEHHHRTSLHGGIGSRAISLSVATGNDGPQEKNKLNIPTSKPMSPAPSIVGGDKETRPVNVAVHWIIKVK